MAVRLWWLLLLWPALARAQAPPAPQHALTLEEALALALERDPELAAAELAREGVAAHRKQAAHRPNPEAEFELENLSGDLPGASEAEATFTLSQRFELGGKRSARVAHAESLMGLADWDRAGIRRDVVREVEVAFAEGLGAQDRLRVSEETLALASEVTSAVDQKMRAGAIPPVEVTRAQVAMARARIEVESARIELRAARRRLALTWGSTAPEFEVLAGALDTLATAPDWPALVQGLDENPDVGRWRDEMAVRQARLQAERSLRVLDLTASAGYRRLMATDQNTFVAGVGIPLPFARNQGAIGVAAAELAQATPQASSARREAERALADAVARLEIAQATVRTLRGAVIPGAATAFEQVKRAYELGKLSYLDLLEARQSLAGARAAEVDALVEIARARAEVGSLTGGTRQ
jgi:outer membrane protein, heavy metal efflux system